MLIDFGVSLCSGFTYADPRNQPGRGYANILGGLIRKYFPGIIDLPTGGRDVAWTWVHYTYTGSPGGDYEHVQDLVVRRFWVLSFDFLAFKHSLVDNSCTNAPCFTCV